MTTAAAAGSAYDVTESVAEVVGRMVIDERVNDGVGVHQAVPQDTKRLCTNKLSPD